MAAVRSAWSSSRASSVNACWLDGSIQQPKARSRLTGAIQIAKRMLALGRLAPGGGAPSRQADQAQTALKALLLSTTGLARVAPFWSTIVTALPDVSNGLPVVVAALMSSK